MLTLNFNEGKQESRFAADILNESLEYGINFPAFGVFFYLFKRVLAMGCVYETSVFGDICTHTHTHTHTRTHRLT